MYVTNSLALSSLYQFILAFFVGNGKLSGAFRVPGSPARGGAFRGSPEARGEPERDRGSERCGNRGHRRVPLGGGGGDCRGKR